MTQNDSPCDHVKTPILIADLRTLEEWMGRFLLTDAGQASPNWESFVGIREEIRGLAEGQALTEYGLICVMLVMKYALTGGVPHAEVFPGPEGRELMLLSALVRARQRRVNRP